jgi:oligosaccharide repeat unit polymerase
MCISFVSRGLYEYSSIEALMQKLIYYFNSYAFAHIYAFSDWFSYYVGAPHIMNYTDKHEIYFGFYTFMPIFEILGSSITVPDGVYDEYFYFSDVFTTNIYTVFRGVILDFRLIGSIVFWFILGLVAHLSYYFLLTKKMPIFSAPFFVVLFGFYYTSFIISLFIWASIGASLALLSLILFVNKYKFLSGRQK